MDPAPLFGVGVIYHFSQWLYLLFAVLGILAAGFSVLAMQAVTWSERGLRRLLLPQWLRPAVGRLLVGGIALLGPQGLGSGHAALQLLFLRGFPLPPLPLPLATQLLAPAPP